MKRPLIEAVEREYIL